MNALPMHPKGLDRRFRFEITIPLHPAAYAEMPQKPRYSICIGVPSVGLAGMCLAVGNSGKCRSQNLSAFEEASRSLGEVLYGSPSKVRADQSLGLNNYYLPPSPARRKASAKAPPLVSGLLLRGAALSVFDDD